MVDLSRVEREIKNHRLWKARDRLFGLLSTYPTSQEVLELLGEVSYKMKDLPEAGRYWYLTEYSDEYVKEAILAFHERCGREPYTIIAQLPLHDQLNKYGPIAQKRINELVEKITDKPPKLKSYFPEDELEEIRETSKWEIWLDRIKSVLASILIIGPWLAGLFTLGIWLTSIIAPSLGEYLLKHWFDLMNLVKVE